MKMAMHTLRSKVDWVLNSDDTVIPKDTTFVYAGCDFRYYKQNVDGTLSKTTYCIPFWQSADEDLFEEY